MGHVLSAMWFSELNPDSADFAKIESVVKETGAQHWFLRRMNNRGADPNLKQVWKSADCPDRWVAHENNLALSFRLDEGTSPGLFLDQRLQRQWVMKEVLKNPDLQVLNLFAYTGGFSVAAAVAGAKTVVTVDHSKGYIDWTKENFHANGLDPDNFEFWSVEALRFLEGSVRRGRKFDLIICDPPSFARTTDGVFQIEKSYERLLDLLLDVAQEKAQIQFSCNLQKWDQREFQKRLQEYARSHALTVQFPVLPEEFQRSKDCSKIAVFQLS